MKRLIMLSVFAVTGCSTIIEGRSQMIEVNTNPPEASCSFERNGDVLGTINPTPGSLYIEKTKYDIKIICSKEGFQDATYLNHSGAAGATVGNILLGGGIGWAIDSSTGADNKYDTPVNITLVPAEQDDDRPKRKHHKS